MNFFLRAVQSITRNGVNIIIESENKQKIRDDFIEFYRACVIPENGPFRSNYFSQNSRYYYEQLLKWRLQAKNFDPHKKTTKKLNEVVDTGGSISDIFTIFETFWTIGWIFAPSLLIISFFEGLHLLISLFFLVLATIVILLNCYIKLLFFFSDEIRHLNENLVINQNDVGFGSKYYGKKDMLIASYIWNRSLCNYSTIYAFLTLLLIKSLAKRLYNKIYTSMIRLLPQYMPEYVKDKSRVKFFKFLLTHKVKNNGQ